MSKRRQINTYLPEDVSKDLEDLQAHFGGIPFTNVIRIAVKKLALTELRKNQAASPANTARKAA
jgi:hypothetical protein